MMSAATEMLATEKEVVAKLNAFKFDGSDASLMDLRLVTNYLWRLRKSIGLVRLEEWKNRQVMENGWNPDEHQGWWSNMDYLFDREADTEEE